MYKYLQRLHNQSDVCTYSYLIAAIKHQVLILFYKFTPASLFPNPVKHYYECHSPILYVIPSGSVNVAAV